MTGSPMTSINLRKADQPTADKSPTRRHGLGLRRAKTATANSIKKLFKGRRDSQTTDNIDSISNASASKNPVNTGRRRSLLPGLESLLPISYSGGNDTVPKVPVVQNLPIESRPSSAHSTRSVRSIFTTAKRITLRSSMLFKNQNHVADFGTNAMMLGEYIPAARIASAPAATSPTAMSAPHSPSSSLQVRHAESPDVYCAEIKDVEYGARSKRPSVAYSQHSMLLTTSSPQTRQPLSLMHYPPMPTQTLPSVPHTPPASYSGSDRQAKSPTSYSSRSLGLSSLDFGYDEHIVHNIMPESPSKSSPSAGSVLSFSAGSSLRQLSPGADQTDDNEGESWGYMEIAMEQQHVGQDDEAEVMVPLIGSEPIELMEIGALNVETDPVSSSEASIELAVGADTLDYLANIVLAKDTVRELGCVDAICSCALIASAEPQSAPVSPYVIRDIDELLVELGIADSLIKGDPTGGVDAPGSFDASLSLGFGPDDDAFSMREIDELLQQLDEAAGFSASKDVPLVPVAVDAARVVGGLGNANNIVQIACASVVVDIRPELVKTPICPACLVAALGNPQALVTAEMVPDSSQVEISIAELIRSLGCVIAVVVSEQFDAGELVCSLGNSEHVVSLALPLIPEHIESPIDVAELICGLGRVVEVEVSEQFDAGELVFSLGNPDYVISLALPLISEHKESLIDVAELLSRLGNIVVPECPRESLLNVVSLVSQLGAVVDVSLAPGNQTPVLPVLDVSRIMADLGVANVPEIILSNAEGVCKASAPTLLLDEETCSTVFINAAPDSHKCSFPSLPVSTDLTKSILHWPTMDVDDNITQDSRSRTSSIVSYNQPFESMHAIPKLMLALHIQPIMVSGPFPGLSRTVLFPHLC
ncbi:hypothetical protein GGH96_005431 [Coemansia sp. RSA 1972]|nr:hypothetical protein GGH96_005431 [Coemansia sp. RSA 1972]